MARQCDICGKQTRAGRQVSHAHNVSRRNFEANVQRVRAFVDGTVKRIHACTRCIRSGKVQKPPARDWQPDTP